MPAAFLISRPLSFCLALLTSPTRSPWKRTSWSLVTSTTPCSSTVSRAQTPGCVGPGCVCSRSASWAALRSLCKLLRNSWPRALPRRLLPFLPHWVTLKMTRDPWKEKAPQGQQIAHAVWGTGFKTQRRECHGWDGGAVLSFSLRNRNLSPGGFSLHTMPWRSAQCTLKKQKRVGEQGRSARCLALWRAPAPQVGARGTRRSSDTVVSVRTKGKRGPK